MSKQTKLMDTFLAGDGGPTDFMSIVAAQFALMPIAEEEISASACNEEQESMAFIVMCPSEPLRGKSKELYRAHCKEMAARVAAGEDTRPGTNAEVLSCMLATALKAPLNPQGLALVDHLFAHVFPGHRIDLGDRPLPEWYAGQVAEDLADARKRCAEADRVPS